jgi:hypothetical protein
MPYPDYEVAYPTEINPHAQRLLEAIHARPQKMATVFMASLMDFSFLGGKL